MKTLMINRDQDLHRLKFQQQQLNDLSIQFERIQAIEKSSLTPELVRKHTSDWQRPLRETEIACTLSHSQCWSIVAESNKPHFIIEDDAVMCKHTLPILEKLETTSGFDVVSLESRNRDKVISKEFTNLPYDYQLHYMHYDKGGAAGYVLWPEGAKKLLQHKKSKGVSPADALIGACNNFTRGQVYPAPLIQLDSCVQYGLDIPCSGATTIGHQSHPAAPSFRIYLTCRWRRIKAQLCLLAKVHIKQFFSSRLVTTFVPIRKSDF